MVVGAPLTSPDKSPPIPRPTSRVRRSGARANRSHLLHEAGSDKSHLLSVTIYLPDIADFGAMNAVWEKWVVADATPERATVQAILAAPEYKVEIQVVAAVAVNA
jgi:enamine deaminase RidA (YjgF/YER057c/UK114 family)